MITALWRRLDVPGHDGAHISRWNDGWRLEGVAVFAHDLGPARLTYRVDCAPDWRTRRAEVTGWAGDRRCDVIVTRDEASGQWHLDGRPVNGLEQCVDVDFGFTPATNFLQLQRCNLQIGETADFQVAWLDVPDAAPIALPQHYEKRSATTCWYESPQNSYSALLEFADSGFVRSYPDLWELENVHLTDK